MANKTRAGTSEGPGPSKTRTGGLKALMVMIREYASDPDRPATGAGRDSDGRSHLTPRGFAYNVSKTQDLTPL